MIIVADTGPIITLIQLNHIFILEKLYPDYAIPEMVYSELMKFESVLKHANLIENVKHHIVPVSGKITNPGYLDDGEAECFELYIKLKADAVLVDDLEARQYAQKTGIKYFGTLSLLLEAKSKQVIQSVKPLLLQMQQNGRYLSNELIALTLKQANE